MVGRGTQVTKNDSLAATAKEKTNRCREISYQPDLRMGTARGARAPPLLLMSSHIRNWFSPLALAAVLFFTSGSQYSIADERRDTSSGSVNGTLEKMIAANGTVTLTLDADRLRGSGASSSAKVTLHFQVGRESWFTILVFNDVMRAAEGGALPLVGATQSGKIPESLGGVMGSLLLEKLPDGGPFELAIRDAESGRVLFNVDRYEYEYDARARLLTVKAARLLLSEEFAKKLGRPSDAGMAIGDLSIAVTTFPIEVTTISDGELRSSRMPAIVHGPDATAAANGPDVIVGDLPTMVQAGSAGTQVGLAIATTSCNNGNAELNWMALPNTDHPVIPQNLYRMSGGAANTDKIEQIGQSWLKHAFTALQQTVCGACTAASSGTHLGVGCSDPYSTGLNGSQTSLGSRAWVNPFTGVFPGGSNPNGSYPSRDHTGHTHSGSSHRLLVEAADLNTSLNTGATYFAEAQYITPHEYAWCQSHPGECNMDNNVSYRRFNVSGTSSFTFSAAAATVRTRPAIFAWTGATVNQVRPAATDDGIAYVAYKITGPTNGLYHYEYAVLNQNLDRAVQSFTVPLGCGINASNLGFHAPLNHPGSAQDGTLNGGGYSNAAWSASQTATALTWSSEAFADNQNANAIRWGTMYNFRFDSDRPPQTANATLGFFKTGSPAPVAIQAPSSPCTPFQLASAVSRKTHTGVGDFDLNLPLTGQPAIESRSGGANGTHTIVVTFSNNVVGGNATVSPAGSGSVDVAPAFSGNTMTLNLTSVLDMQQLTVTLTGLTDSFSQTMPDTAVQIGFLVGDVNGDGAVNSADAQLTRNRSGQSADASNFRSDVNTDGAVNGGDTTAIRARSGNGLTSPAENAQR